MIRTVQELIEELQKIEDKTKSIYFYEEEDYQGTYQVDTIEYYDDGDIKVIIKP